jgi:Rrf2 family cysteine metabolism transcriptional repressor
MRISTKGEYGLRALFDLAQHAGAAPVQSAQIAQRQQIPENYLSQLLLIMRNHGLIKSIRGPQGGHLLARAADDINLAEVLTALEGPFLPMECVNPDFTDCALMDICVIRDVWRDLKAATDDVLSSTTLADLLQNSAKRETEAMYYI